MSEDLSALSNNLRSKRIFDHGLVGQQRPRAEKAFLPYEKLEVCLAKLEGLEAIDYFFAQYLVSLFQNDSRYFALSDEQQRLCFHLLLALNYTQRQGSSCLVVDTLAEQQMWSSSAQNVDQDLSDGSRPQADDDASVGYRFGTLDQIQDVFGLISSLAETVDGIICEANRLYTEKYHTYEQSVCAHIKHKLAASQQMRSNIEASVVNDAGFKASIEQDWPLLFPLSQPNADASALSQNALTTDWQQVAVMNSLSSMFSVISGGAGTGKTYTLSRLLVTMIRGLGIHPSRIALLAPTGKAVNRLSTSLKEELSRLALLPEFEGLAQVHPQLSVQTVHRLLGIHPVDGRCKYDQERLMPFDCVILDEASMLDLALMHRLLRAMPLDCRFVMVGDPKQLPSVETGCLLADVVACAYTQPIKNSARIFAQLNAKLNIDTRDFSEQDFVPVEQSQDNEALAAFTQPNRLHDFMVNLTSVRRSEAALVSVAQAILDKNIDGFFASQCEQFVWHNNAIENSRRTELEQLIEQFLMPKLEVSISAKSVLEAWHSLSQYACLVPNRKGFGGVEWLNQYIALRLSEKYAWVNVGKAYKGKAIMVTQNDYSLGLFNGDVGILWPDDKGEFWAHFPTDIPGEFQAHSLFTLPSYESVYAMTIHKTQGSEYQHVDILLPKHTQAYLSNELLYTAATRAKAQLRIFADRSSVELGLRREVKRVSGISEKLIR